MRNTEVRDNVLLMYSITILSHSFKLILGLIVTLTDVMCMVLCENASQSVLKRESENTVKDRKHIYLLIISRLTEEETAHTDVTSRSI